MEDNKKEELVNETTNKAMKTIRVQMEEAFTLGMKYSRLSIVDKLVPVLKQNEFDENSIAIVLRDIGALKEVTYADVFTNIDSSDN